MRDVRVLEYASEDFKKDKDIAMDSLSQNYSSIEFVSEELKNDREFMKDMLRRNGHILAFLDKKFSNDRDYITAAVLNDVRSLEYASENLKSNNFFLLT
jgi:hypothetical protein